MQLTTMRYTKAPSASCTAGTTASMTISAMETNVATIRTKVERRIALGMWCRAPDTRTLEAVSTKSVARPMASPLATVFVTASAGHSPRSWTNTGFSRQMPLERS